MYKKMEKKYIDLVHGERERERLYQKRKYQSPLKVNKHYSITATSPRQPGLSAGGWPDKRVPAHPLEYGPQCGDVQGR